MILSIVPTMVIRQEKEVKGIQIGKKERKGERRKRKKNKTLSADDVTYIENSKPLQRYPSL